LLAYIGFLSNPAVQGGVAPFVAALVVALALRPLRLDGLAVIAAFLTCMYFVSGLQFIPLTATRKVIVLGMAAPIIGVLVDFAFKPSRISAALLLSLGAGAGVLWAFWPVLVQKPIAEAWLLGGTAVIGLAFMVGFAQLKLAEDAVRAGATALALGLGTGVAAIFGASASYGMYGIALGAGAGAFLLPQMIRGTKSFAGTTFTLTAMLLAGLVAAGAAIIANVPWYSLAVLALVPAAVRLPGPSKAAVWLQTILFSLYGFIVAAVACVLAWPPPHQL
jgi:hypothetical protein